VATMVSQALPPVAADVQALFVAENALTPEAL
jgi:hypothetical protein